MRKRLLAWILCAALVMTPMTSVMAEDLIIEYEEAVESSAAEELSMTDLFIAESEQIEAIQTEMETEADQTEAYIENEADQTEADTEAETEEVQNESETENDGFVVAIEEAEAPEGLLAEELETELPDMLVSGTLNETGYASSAVMPMMRMFSRTVYSGSFGSQLSGLSAELYAAFEASYVTEKGSAQIVNVLSEPYVFAVPDLEIVETDGVKRAKWDPQSNEEYLLAAEEIRYGIQSAYDAFIYDHPEVFWIAAPSYVWSISFSGNASADYKGKISQVVIKPNECYDGAASEIAAFDQAVAAEAAEIAAGLPESASRRVIVEAIHDYLCNTVSYASNDYAHTAAGIFLKDRMVVCEGYAKAFKILCGVFGIDSVMVPGGALKSNGSIEAHMWNYVCMEDGCWYLVDATWDDQKSYISRKYFLAGSLSNGFVSTIEEERTVYPKFSGEASVSQSFTMPGLSLEGYGIHSWNEELTVDQEATCTEKGISSIHCSVCDAVQEGSECWIPVTEHSWNSEKTVDREATCTASGQKSTHCSVCDAVLEGSEETIAQLSHTYGSYQVTKEATVLEQGVKTRTCSVCGKKQNKAIAKLERTMTVNVTSLRLQVGQSTTKVTVTGLGKGDSVASWKSSDTSVATVTSKGKITAKKAGKAVITITLKSKLSKKVTVTVQKSTVKTTKISGLKSSVTIKKGKTLTLSPVLTPITSQEKITYTSKNKKVATVSSKGVITAKGPGTTQIIVKSGSKSVTVTVKVPVTKTTKITTAASVTISKGKTKTLSVKLTPSNSDQAVTFTSKNKAIATVDKNGKVTAKKKGTTYIVIKSGSISRNVKITVK